MYIIEYFRSKVKKEKAFSTKKWRSPALFPARERAEDRLRFLLCGEINDLRLDEGNQLFRIQQELAALHSGADRDLVI